MNKSVNSKDVEKFVRHKIKQLAFGSDSARALAELRRGIGKEPGDQPQLWGYFLEEMPDEMMGNNEPSRAEWAIYTALTLFALHQQGYNPNSSLMDCEGVSFGSAVSKMKTPDNKESLDRRFRIISTSAGMEELSNHLRSMIQLLKGEGIGLDYGMLASDLYRFQFPELASRVRLKWGEDYYRTNRSSKMEGEN